jgi:hypothetical protein
MTDMEIDTNARSEANSTSVVKRKSGRENTLPVLASSQESPRSGEGVLALLERFGVDESTVQSMMEKWRGQVSDKVSRKIQEADLLELLDSAREMAKASGGKLKTYSKANPGMFYSGVVAIMAGAGLLAAAAKSAEVDENSDMAL